MSLDIYLISDKSVAIPLTSGIFVRKNGQTIEISEEEWYNEHPGIEPVRIFDNKEETNEVFHYNITHNLGEMAGAGQDLYKALWRPEELGFTKAKELIPVLSLNLQLLYDLPERFKALSPSNGWGTYEGLLSCVSAYLNACIEYPESTIEISR